MAPDLPTTRDDCRLVARALQVVLGKRSYAVLAVGAGVLAAVSMALSSNLAFNVHALLVGDVSLETKLLVVVFQLPVVGPAFEPVRGALLYATAAVVGATVALLVAHLGAHSAAAVWRGSGSPAGVVLGTLGIGSAAVGPAIAGVALGRTDDTGRVTSLPYEGLEVSALAAVVLLLSMYWLADCMEDAEIGGRSATVRRQ